MINSQISTIPNRVMCGLELFCIVSVRWINIDIEDELLGVLILFL